MTLVLFVCVAFLLLWVAVLVGCYQRPKRLNLVLTIGLERKLKRIMATQEEIIVQLQEVRSAQETAMATLRRIEQDTDGLLAKIEDLLSKANEASPELVSAVEEIKSGISAINAAALNLDYKVPGNEPTPPEPEPEPEQPEA